MTSEPGDAGRSSGHSEIVPTGARLEAVHDGLVNRFARAWKAKYGRFIAAAALGSIPWIGGVLSAAIALQAEGGQEKLDDASCDSGYLRRQRNSDLIPFNTSTKTPCKRSPRERRGLFRAACRAI